MILLENNPSEQSLIQVIKKAPNKEWMEQYLDLAKELLEFTGLKEDDPRFSISSTKDYGIGINVNFRHSLTSVNRGKSLTGFLFGYNVENIADLKARANFSWQFRPHHGEISDKTPYILRFEGLPKNTLTSEQKKAWLETVLIELNRAKASPYKRYHNPFAYKAIVDLEYRGLILEEAFPDSTIITEEKILPSPISRSRNAEFQENMQKKRLSDFWNHPIDIQSQKLEAEGYFNAENLEDAREKVTRSIVQRLGQREFRKKLLNAYGGKCAVTGCDVEQAIEAAHIIPYQGEHTNDPSNGLPLRADVHTLFDLYLLSVAPDTYEVVIAAKLKGTYYQKLAGKKLTMPKDQSVLPSPEALSKHYEIFLK